jgi:uncharacterized damage-inducible protein DinB
MYLREKVLGVNILKQFFEYNWQVRDEWFEWCKQLTTKEMNEKRTGGVGSILHTLFHIAEVEYSWVRGIQGKEDRVFNFCDYDTLDKVQSLSGELRIEISSFLSTVSDDLGKEHVNVPWDKDSYTVNEILHHIVIHEIHHIGQLSVWSRELNLGPVQSNFIGRKFGTLNMTDYN